MHLLDGGMEGKGLTGRVCIRVEGLGIWTSEREEHLRIGRHVEALVCLVDAWVKLCVQTSKQDTHLPTLKPHMI